VLSNDSEDELIIDAGPLIYLAKIDALDILWAERPGWIAEAVRREAIVPQAAYRFPEIARIDSALDDNRILVTELQDSETEVASGFADRVPGLGLGERETMAIALERDWTALLFDRRARRVADGFGIRQTGIAELLFARTADDQLLKRRVRAFGSLVAMRIEALEELLKVIRERR
jgi:predicted nucleic acid-binding protein